MKNSRILLQIFYLFLLISIFSFYVINNYTFIQEKFGNNEKFNAFLILFPSIPYLLAVILFIFGWRYQDIGLLIATISLIFLFYTFEINLAKPSGLFLAAFTLFPLNMLIASSSHRKKILSSNGLFWLIIFAIEIYIIIMLCNITDIYNKSGRDASVIISALYGLNNVFCSLMKYSFTVFSISIPILSLLTFLLSFIVLIITFLKKKSPLHLGYLLTLIIIFLAYLIPQTSFNASMFFVFAFTIILISMINSSFLLAYIDELTGIPARRSLDEDLKHIGKKTAIVMIDIDFFKKFNDKYGHKTGDQALKMVASRLSRTSGNPKYYRYGGEEFTAIFTGKNASMAYEYMEQYRKELAEADFYIRDTDRKKHTEEDRGKIKKQNRKTKITVSIGIAFYSKELNTGEKLIKAADNALYKAKKTGRNRIKLYNKGLGYE